MLFNAGNGDADNHLSSFSCNDETLGARCDKRRVVRNDRGVRDFDAQARGSVGCAHNIANAARKLNYPLSEDVVLTGSPIDLVIRRLLFGKAASR